MPAIDRTIFKSILSNRSKHIYLLLALILMLGLSFSGCCELPCNIYYTHNISPPLNKTNFVFGRNFGIAVCANVLPDLFGIVASQVNNFSGHELNFQNLSSEIALNNEHTMIENMDYLKSRFGDMQYMIVVNPFLPEIRNRIRQINEGEKYDQDSLNPLGTKTATTDITRYTSSSSLQCETILFDLIQGKLVARAVNTFEGKIIIEEKDTFKNKTLLGTVEEILKITGKAQAPVIKQMPMGIFEDYFKEFLNHIGEDDCHNPGKRPYRSSTPPDCCPN